MKPLEPVTAALSDHVATLSALGEALAQTAGLPVRTLSRLLGQPVEGLPERERGMQAHLAALHRELAEARLALTSQAPEHVEPASQVPAALAAAKRQLFRNMEPTLLQLPVVRHAVAQGGATTASDVLALLEPLEHALVSWGYEPVGQVGAVVPFAPELHHAVTGEPASGDAVRVRTPGYRLDGALIVRARVRPA
jgi:hypothetical protein